jgi:CheY-like chemotaxis protein
VRPRNLAIPLRPTELLAVDDDEETRVIRRAYVTVSGFRVREATNGAAAMDERVAACPDAMVLDVEMPKVDGLAVLRFVRASLAVCTLPVLALSAYARPTPSSPPQGCRAPRLDDPRPPPPSLVPRRSSLLPTSYPSCPPRRRCCPRACHYGGRWRSLMQYHRADSFLGVP